MRPSERLRRLEMLKDMLERHEGIFKPRKIKFEMDRWSGASHNTCGTAACALGSAAQYPPFMEMGLGLLENTSCTSLLGPAPAYKNHIAFDAGCEFFSITEEESDYLFDPEQYEEHGKRKITTLSVARRVQELISTYREAAMVLWLVGKALEVLGK